MSIRYDYVYINGRKVAKHVAVWEAANGPKPPNHDIHHIDGNSHNNDLSNLVCLTKAEHQKLHRDLRKEGRDIIDSTDPDVIFDREHARAERKAAYERDPEKYHERDRVYRETHKDHIAAKGKVYYEANRERIRETQREYELKHKDDRAARNAAYYAAHSEQRKAEAKLYREQNREAVLEQRKRYRETHAEEIETRASAHRKQFGPYLAASSACTWHASAGFRKT